MASRRYLNFDLLLEQEADGHYQALVTGSPLGETPSVRFTLPFDATTLEVLLLKLDPGRSGTRRVGGTSQQQATMDFGGPLYRAIFRDDLLLTWSRSQDLARQQDAGLRLRLRLKDAPAIAGLPWELLYDARTNTFLAQSERTPLVRFLDVPQVPRPMAVDGPLRVLAIISSPTDLDELDVEAEWLRISEALAPRTAAGLVVLDRLPSATVAELGGWLRRHETHVVHFVGHGDFDDRLREGVVYFQDQHGRSSPVTSSVLGPYLRDHDPLRMVVLNACRSARTDAVDPFGGMAQGLVQQDATAVVAMQFPISDRAAVMFTGEFYGALVDGLPVDQAVSSARKALQASFRDEWATPVLFLRSPDGNIFENVHADPGVVRGSAEPPPPPPSPPLPAPGPSFLKLAALWVRAHQKGVGAGVLALLVVSVSVVVALRLGEDEGDDLTSDDGGLPASRALAPGELVISAGDDVGQQRIWLVDAQDPANRRQLSFGSTMEWLPVLSPDRRTLVYSRTKPGPTSYELRAAGAADGAGDRLLFPTTPTECAGTAGRPAWFEEPDESLVLRCRGDDGKWRLLLATVKGDIERQYTVRDAAGVTIASFGDPTLSPDGETIVVFASTLDSADGGSLYAIDVGSGESRLLAQAEVSKQYSDTVFSPDGTMLAFRKIIEGNYDIVVAPFVADAPLGPQVRLTSDPAKDQDPMFSPDGTLIAYGHVVRADSQRIWVVEATGGTPRTLLPDPVAPWESLPAWSRR